MRVEASGVRGEGRVVAVTVPLGQWVGVDCVFDRKSVQPELVGDQRQLVCIRCYEVDPDHGARVLEVFGKLVGGEVGVRQDTIDVAAGAGHTETVVGDAGRLGQGVGRFRQDILRGALMDRGLESVASIACCLPGHPQRRRSGSLAA